MVLTSHSAFLHPLNNKGIDNHGLPGAITLTGNMFYNVENRMVVNPSEKRP
jgi:hypothetical protein